MNHADEPNDVAKPDESLEHLFPPTPEMTPEQAEENIRRIVEALEALNREDAADQPESEEKPEET